MFEFSFFQTALPISSNSHRAVYCSQVNSWCSSKPQFSIDTLRRIRLLVHFLIARLSRVILFWMRRHTKVRHQLRSIQLGCTLFPLADNLGFMPLPWCMYRSTDAAQLLVSGVCQSKFERRGVLGDRELLPQICVFKIWQFRWDGSILLRYRSKRWRTSSRAGPVQCWCSPRPELWWGLTRWLDAWYQLSYPLKCLSGTAKSRFSLLEHTWVDVNFDLLFSDLWCISWSWPRYELVYPAIRPYSVKSSHDIRVCRKLTCRTGQKL